MIGQQYDVNLTKDGDKFLIFGERAEDYIMGGFIAKHWTDANVYRYPSLYDEDLSKRYKDDVLRHFGPAQIRKNGTVHITISTNKVSINDVSTDEYQNYDWVLNADGFYFVSHIVYCKREQL